MKLTILIASVLFLVGCGHNQWAESFSHPADVPTALPLWQDTTVRVVRVPPDANHRTHVATADILLDYLGESQLYSEDKPDLDNGDLITFAKSIGADVVGLESVLQTSTRDTGFWTGSAWAKNTNTYSVKATYWHTTGIH